MEPPYQLWATSKLGHERSSSSLLQSLVLGVLWSYPMQHIQGIQESQGKESRNHHRARPHRGKQKCKSSGKKGTPAAGTGRAYFKDSAMTQRTQSSRSLLLPSNPRPTHSALSLSLPQLLRMPTAGHNFLLSRGTVLDSVPLSQSWKLNSWGERRGS